MAAAMDVSSDHRRGALPAHEAYLRAVGDRVRLARSRRGVSRKALSQASGVSERYLAELERGAGNASVIVLRQVADALGVPVAALVSNDPEPSPAMELILQHLQRLAPHELEQARELLARQFAKPDETGGRRRRIALVGLRGAGKTTLGQRLAKDLGIPFVELDREIERASGMELSEIFAMHGQAIFRQLERQCLDAVIERFEDVIVATGGSLVTEPATYERLLSAFYVAWLTAKPEEHMARVLAQGDLRPMADSPQAMDELRAILDSRKALYARADAVVDTSGLSEDEAAAALRKTLHGRGDTVTA